MSVRAKDVGAFIRDVRTAPGLADDFARILRMSEPRIAEAVRRSQEERIEKGVTICWMSPSQAAKSAASAWLRGTPKESKIQSGRRTMIVLSSCPADANATATVHTHPDEPDDPSLSLQDQKAAFFSPEEIAQAVAGRRSMEVMLSPHRGPMRARGRATVMALEALVRAGAMPERTAMRQVRLMFPSLFFRMKRGG